MSDELVRERQGAVLVARLNRPDARNALTPDLIRDIGNTIVDDSTGRAFLRLTEGNGQGADRGGGTFLGTPFIEKRTPVWRAR